MGWINGRASDLAPAIMLLDHHKMVENSTMGEHWRRRWGGEPLVDEEGGGEAKQRKVGSRLDLDLWIRIQFSFIGPFLSFFFACGICCERGGRKTGGVGHRTKINQWNAGWWKTEHFGPF
jgi:hypothetical protein